MHSPYPFTTQKWWTLFWVFLFLCCGVSTVIKMLSSSIHLYLCIPTRKRSRIPLNQEKRITRQRCPIGVFSYGPFWNMCAGCSCLKLNKAHRCTRHAYMDAGEEYTLVFFWPLCWKGVDVGFGNATNLVGGAVSWMWLFTAKSCTFKLRQMTMQSFKLACSHCINKLGLFAYHL